MTKAKELLIGEIRKLRSKAVQKRREAEKLEEQAEELRKQADAMN